MKQFHLDAGNGAYRIVHDVLVMHAGQEPIGTFRLSPLFDGKSAVLAPWTESGGEYSAPIKGQAASVHLAVRSGCLAYWIEGDFEYIERLTYLPGSELCCRNWQSYVSDEHDRTWTMQADRGITVAATVDPDKQKCQADPGDNPPTWMLCPQPRTVSFEIRDGEWIGFSIPGPLPVGATRFIVDDERFSIVFDSVCGSTRGGSLPAVYFVTALTDAYAVLDAHLAISRDLGLVREDKPYYAWWSRPMYDTWGQQLLYGNPCSAANTPLTQTNVSDWVRDLEDKSGINDFTVCIDVGWFEHYGDFKAGARLGGTAGLRALIDDLHGGGHKVILWFCPYMVSSESELAASIPECMVRDRDGNLVTTHLYQLVDDNCDKSLIGNQNGFLDYSRPAVREHMKAVIRCCLSPEPGCLDADGFKFDFNHQTPHPGRHTLYDTSWAAGDQMWHAVARLTHERVHEVKADALITCSVSDVYMQPYVDMVRLGDSFVDSPSHWFRRARLISKLFPGTLIDSDTWYMTRSKALQYWPCSAVYGVPSFMQLVQFDDGGGRLTAADHSRLRAIWHLVEANPIEPDMAFCVDPENGVFERKYTSGPLAGFYAALAVDNHCLVIYNIDEALLAATRDMEVTIPLPADCRIEKVECVWVSGKTESVDAPASGNGLTLRVSDAGTGILHYRIRYTLN